MRLRSVALLLATLVAASPLVAHYPGGYQPSGGMGRGGGFGGGGRGGRMGRGSFDPSAFPSPEDIDGPPTPGTFKQVLELTDEQMDAYRHAWDSLMTATTPQRDSARVARQTMRDAGRGGDRDVMREQAKLLMRLGKDLRKGNEAFDKSLSFLSADQRKQYEDWQKQQRKAREDERRQRFRGGPGGTGPPAPE